MMRYAEVAVDAPVSPARTFSYSIPDRFRIQPGQLVWVPFGRRILQGVVIELASAPRVEVTKDILQAVEPSPLLDATALTLAQWLSRYYLCPLFDAVALFLPPGFKAQVRSQILPIPVDAANLEKLKSPAREALETLAGRQRLTEAEFAKLLGKRSGPEVNRLAQRGLIHRRVDLPRPRTFRYVSQLFPASPQDDLGHWPEAPDKLPARQEKLLQAVREQAGSYSTAQANKEFGSGVGNALVEKGLLGLEWVRQEGSPLSSAASSVASNQAARPNTSGQPDDPDSLLPDDPAANGAEPPLTLFPMQADALARIAETLDDPARQPRTFLLHGVTGSGKTEVYLQAIQRVVEQGKQAIFLVPEIALTPQTVQRVNARFPGRAAVLHSGLSERQRFDQWWKIRDGDYDVVVGPRSALFAPAPNLGLIVIDEEHEWTYKQVEAQPFYHARTAALELARLTGAGVILGSATPDVESYHHARRGRYRLLELPHRIRQAAPPPGRDEQEGDNNAQDLRSEFDELIQPTHGEFDELTELAHGELTELAHGELGEFPQPAHGEPVEPPLAPNLSTNGKGRDAGKMPASADAEGLAPVEVCDMRQELRQGNRSIFSRSLSQALTRCIERKQQAILFLNRRGSAPIVQCRDCGYVVTCSGCAVSLTYHSTEARLRCHRCNRRSRSPRQCRQCAGSHIRQLGIGTQRVVDEVRALLPEAQVERWDADSVRTGPGTEETMRRLAAGETQVLVGTQMVAKGLDVPNVTLVGVVLADVGIHLPDFRAGERAFGLLCQVAGRAGRGAEPGRVIIQTYNPDHYAVAAAARQDYAVLFRTEIAARHQQGNPPFNRLVHLLYQDLNPTTCQQQAITAARQFRQLIRAQGLTDVQVIGPAPGIPERVRGQYRWRLILRGRNLHRFLEGTDLSSRGLTIDVDPVHLL